MKKIINFVIAIFAMTIVLFALPARAQTVSICQHWIDSWRTHSGTLPDGSRIPTSNNGAREWSVTANTPVGLRTVHGQAWCHNTHTGSVGPLEHNTAGHHCWCRLTEPYVGPWVFATGDISLPPSACANSCANHCSNCVLTEPIGLSCKRRTLFALP